MILGFALYTLYTVLCLSLGILLGVAGAVRLMERY